MHLRTILLTVIIPIIISACGPSTPAPDSPTQVDPSILTEPVGPVVTPGDPNIPQPTPPTAGGNMPPNPYAPADTDDSLMRGSIFIEETGVLVMESYPVQISVSLMGNLPNPCHQLRVTVTPPDAQNKITLDVYSVVDPNMLCTEVLSPFQASIPLGTFPAGHYTVWINDEMIGEFDS